MLPRLLFVVGMTIGVMAPLIWTAYVSVPAFRGVAEPARRMVQNRTVEAAVAETPRAVPAVPPAAPVSGFGAAAATVSISPEPAPGASPPVPSPPAATTPAAPLRQREASVAPAQGVAPQAAVPTASPRPPSEAPNVSPFNGAPAAEPAKPAPSQTEQRQTEQRLAAPAPIRSEPLRQSPPQQARVADPAPAAAPSPHIRVVPPEAPTAGVALAPDHALPDKPPQILPDARSGDETRRGDRSRPATREPPRRRMVYRGPPRRGVDMIDIYEPNGPRIIIICSGLTKRQKLRMGCL